MPVSTALDINNSPHAVRILITGGPGTGKSTLLAALAQSGEICYEEASRALIREQLAHEGQLVPWGNLLGFAQECCARMRAQLADSPADRRCFFDRGLPDLIAYLRHGGLPAPDAWCTASRAYARVTFFAPPWAEIFVNDPERPQSFSEACALSDHIRYAYQTCGFQLIELVRDRVEMRRAQVLNYLRTNPYDLRRG